MRPRRSERAQAVQVGAVLLFATLVVLLSLYQAFLVPQQNQEIEFTDYQHASTDLVKLRNDVVAAGNGGDSQGQTVRTGSTYPSRIFFLNPPSAAGRLSTGSKRTVTFSHLSAVGADPNLDAWLAHVNGTLSFDTRPIRFDPAYNEFEAPAVVAEQGVVYRNYSNPVALTSQTLLQGSRVTFTAIAGQYEQSGTTAGVTVDPVSPHEGAVTITGRNGNDPVITLGTDLSASTWQTLLAPQIADGSVLGVTNASTPGAVNVTLAANSQYVLRLARVELHGTDAPGTESTPGPAYLTSKTERDTSTGSDGRIKLVVDAHDRYNNPVAATNVTFNQSSAKGTFETESGANVTDLAPGNPGTTVSTDANGEAVVYYNATNYLGNIPVQAYLGNDTTAQPWETVSYKVFNSVTNTGTGGGGNSGEQAGRILVVLNETSPPTSDSVTVYVDNRGDFPVNLTGYRLDYVTGVSSNGGIYDLAGAIDSATFDTAGTPITRNGVAQEARSPYFFNSSSVITVPANAKHYGIQITFDNDLTSKPAGGGSQSGVLVSFSFYIEGGLTTTITVHYAG